MSSNITPGSLRKIKQVCGIDVTLLQTPHDRRSRNVKYDSIVTIIARGKKRRPSEHVFRSSRLLDHDESQKETTLSFSLTPARASSSERWKGPLDNHSTFYIVLPPHHHQPPCPPPLPPRNPHRADANNVCRYIASHASLAPQIVL